MVDLGPILAGVEARVPLHSEASVDLGRILDRVSGHDMVIATARGPRGSVELLGDDMLRFSSNKRYFSTATVQGHRGPFHTISLNFVNALADPDERWIGFQVVAKKGRGRPTAYGWLQAYPENFKKAELDMDSDYPECEADWKCLARRVGHSRLALWFVGSVWLPSQLRGYGVGRLMYEQLLLAASRRCAAIAPDRCGPFGSTSEAAMRVWNRLVRVHPHQGYVVVRTDLLGCR